MRLDKLSLQFALYETGQEADVLEAYERLIYDAMSGDHTLFTTAEGIERLWEVSVPLLEAPPEVELYRQGSWGPSSIRELIVAGERGGFPSNGAGGNVTESSRTWAGPGVSLVRAHGAYGMRTTLPRVWRFSTSV